MIRHTDMPPPPDRDELTAFHEELLILIEQARARGDALVPDGFVPDYWYGVATGYQDAAERFEVFLKEKTD